MRSFFLTSTKINLMFVVAKIKEVESKIRIIRDQKVILKCTVGITFKN